MYTDTDNNNAARKFMKYDEVMGRLASLMEAEKGMKPFDKEIAFALGIKSATYAVNKARNKIPFRKILEYCAERRIEAGLIFFGKAQNE